MDRREFFKSLGAAGAALSMSQAATAQSIRRGFGTAVVGAGVFGAWIAATLQARGQRVVLVDAVAPAHSRASSGGESRVTRCGYGNQAHYSQMARASLRAWKTLSDQAALPLFHRLGVLWVSENEDPEQRASEETLRRLDIPFQKLTASELRDRYPLMQVADTEQALLEPDAGALMARRAVQTVIARFIENGGTLLGGTVRPVYRSDAPAGRLASIDLAGRGRLEADHFVFACGPWLDRVCPDAVQDRITATRQEVFYFAASPRETGALPVWADLPFYGMPDLEGRGFKVADDDLGPVIDPDTQIRRASLEGEERARAFLSRRFPSLADRPLTEARVCQYENSPTRDLILSPHPGVENTWIAGGGSGHGFKHGPEVGRIMADLVTGLADPTPRFAL